MARSIPSLDTIDWTRLFKKKHFDSTGGENYGLVPHQHGLSPGAHHPTCPVHETIRALHPKSMQMRNSEIFQAPTWARGPHHQTILARVLRPAPPIRSVRERIETPDDDFVDVDWSALNVSDAPIVIVLHGLKALRTAST